jgi:hypothetical protein
MITPKIVEPFSSEAFSREGVFPLSWESKRSERLRKRLLKITEEVQCPRLCGGENLKAEQVIDSRGFNKRTALHKIRWK